MKINVIENLKNSIMMIQKVRNYAGKKDFATISIAVYYNGRKLGVGMRNNRQSRRCIVAVVLDDVYNRVLTVFSVLFVFFGGVLSNIFIVVAGFLLLILSLIITLFYAYYIRKIHKYIIWGDDRRGDDDDEDPLCDPEPPVGLKDFFDEFSKTTASI